MLGNIFYVYVYIDPRNNSEFYFGKGKEDRKFVHLHDKLPSKKKQIIDEIISQGLRPIIKVIAKDLRHEEALLIESTLIWKYGEKLSNKVQGNYSSHFRPQNTLGIDLYAFDYENGVYCLNVGEGEHRCWEDSAQYGFISAGQNWKKWGSRISAMKKGDVICAYLSRYGYVGIGVILAEAVPVLNFKVKNIPLVKLPLKQSNIYKDNAGTENGEFLVQVDWISLKTKKDAVGKSKSFWRARSMLGSLENQNETRRFLEKEFNVSFEKLLKKE